jgi:Acetyltransferase (GNAT) domain
MAAAAEVVPRMFRITIVRAGLVSDHRVGRFPSGIYVVTVERISDGFLSWRPLIAGDLPMLAEWLRELQVARWWNHETTLEAVERDFGASTRGEEPGEDLLVLLDGRPIGLVQRSVLVAVVAANVASWRALEKAGLKRVAEGPMPPDNPIDDPLHYIYRVDRPDDSLRGACTVRSEGGQQ